VNATRPRFIIFTSGEVEWLRHLNMADIEAVRTVKTLTKSQPRRSQIRRMPLSISTFDPPSFNYPRLMIELRSTGMK
jgi:hypothetical protein